MKKTIIRNIFLIALAFSTGIFIGCASANLNAFKTLGSTEVAVTAAYSGYVDLVIQGKVPTNGIPNVSHAFNAFQSGMSAAVIAAQFNTNSIATADVAALAQNVNDAIANAKLVK